MAKKPTGKHERHHTRRRFRHAPVPHHHHNLQAVAADLRQAHELLFLVNPIVSWAMKSPELADSLRTGMTPIRGIPI